MVASVREDLDREMECLDLLRCIYGLNERDQTVFQVLQGAEEELSVDDVAARLECERSTAYRSVSRLLEAGVVTQQQVNYDNGGYYYAYRERAPEEVAHEMQRLLNDWYAAISQLIQEFEDTYARTASDRETRSLQSRSCIVSNLILSWRSGSARID